MISSFPILSTKWRWETREKTSSEADTVILRAGSALLKAFIWVASSLNKTSVVGLRTPIVGNLGFGSFIGSPRLGNRLGNRIRSFLWLRFLAFGIRACQLSCGAPRGKDFWCFP